MKQIAAERSIANAQRQHAVLLPAAGGHSALSHEQALFQPELARSLQMHGKLAAFVALAGLAFTTAYFFSLWPNYEAKSLLYVQPVTGSLMNQNNTGRWPLDATTYESFIQQKMSDVTRPDVMTAALHKMDPGLWQKGGESDQAAADRLSHAIQVERSGAYQLSIGVRSGNPETAAALANAVTTAYLETTARDSRAGDTQRLAILKEEHDRVAAELNADRAEQSNLSRQLGMASPLPTAPDLYDEQIARTRDELIRVRTEHDEAAARFAAMNAGSAGATSAIDAQADEVAAADTGLSSMKTSLNQRKATLVSQMANLTPQHPLYKQDATELEKINSELETASRELHTQAVSRIQQKLRSDMQRTAAVEDQLNGQLRSAVGAAAGASIKLQRANDLNADILRLQNRYAAVDEQLHNLMLDTGAPGAIVLISAAQPPLHAIRSGVFRNTFVLAGFSILFGLFVAVLAHKLDPRIYVASDVEHVLGFAPLAQLPHFAQVSEEVEAEHLIRLAGDIEHVALQDGIHTVALTSAAEGSGVASLAARLRPLLTPAAASLTEGEPPAGVNLVEAGSLLVSAEAEFQVRRAGWTLAVIESGVTTRSELRQMAGALKRLDTPAVGFILNQIPLDKAEPSFRHAIRNAERHVERSGGSSPLRILEQRQQQAAMTPAPQDQLPLPVAAPPQQPAAEASSFAQAAGTDPWWLSPLAPVAAAQPAPVDARPQPPAAVASSPAASVPPPAPAPQPSRLNGLRGSSFQLGLMHLNRANGSPVAAPAPAAPQSVPSVAPNVFQASAEAPAPVPPFVPSSAQPVPPAPQPEPVQQAVRPVPPPVRPAEAAFTPSPRQVVAVPEFLPPPREFIPIRDELSDEDGTASRDRRDPYDELDILPSWRGQYRKRS